MNLSSPFIKRPVMTVLVMVGILFFGIFAYQKLPVSNMPDVEYPTIVVSASQMGADAETMASTVATPLEKQFMTINGLNMLVSQSTFGSTSITLRFDINVSTDRAAQDVQAAISAAEVNLPTTLDAPPTYSKTNPADIPIMYLVFSSDAMPSYDLYDYCSIYVSKRLSMIPGVSLVTVYGAPKAFRAQLDPKKMTAYGVGMNEVVNAIRSANVNMPAGSLSGKDIAYTLSTEHLVDSGEKLSSVIIRAEGDQFLRLKDIGQGVASAESTRFTMRYLKGDINKSCIPIAISKQPGSNTVAIAKKIEQFLPELRESLPQSIYMDVLMDRAEPIVESVDEVKFTLMLAVLLVVLVIFLYLGKLVETIIPILVLPMSMIGSTIALYLLGFTIDILSLLAMTLAIGFVIDDAIVVLENIVRNVERGLKPYEAALEGSKQISVTVMTMTFALSVVFVPIVFMGGLMGRVFFEFSCTIILTILISGFISLTLTPMLCSRFIRPSNGSIKKRPIQALILHFYEKTLVIALRQKFLVVLLGLATLVVSIYLLGAIPKNFIPSDDYGFLRGFTQMQLGASAEDMERHQKKIEEIIHRDPATDSMVSLAGIPAENQGFVFVHLKPMDERGSIESVMMRMMAAMNQVPGVQGFLVNPPMINLSIGGTGKGSYDFVLQAVDTHTLYQAAHEFLPKLQNVSLITNVSSDLEDDQPQVRIKVNAEKAAKYGLSVKEVASLINYSFSGAKIDTVSTPAQQYDILLELLPEYQRKPENLSLIQLTTSKGKIPLSEVAEWEVKSAVSQVDHLDQLPAVYFSFSLKPGIALSEAIQEIEAIASTLPAGVKGRLTGSAEEFESIVRNLAILLLITVFVIYLVLGILYESFIHPITVISALPTACLGGLITLYVFNQALSIYSVVGLVMLLGIVQKNGIILVDFAQDALKGGKGAYDAIVEACLVRFRPIMMTTIAAIVGTLPIALGGGLGGLARRPLGMVVVGGLVISQLITLYLIPVVYLILSPKGKSEVSSVEPKAKDDQEG